MGPVSNATGLSMRAAAGARSNGASGARQGSSDVSSHEPLTYAHLGASRFSHESLNDKTQAIQGRSAAYADSASQGGFRELMEASALALSPSGDASPVDQTAPRAPAADGLQGGAAAAKAPTFSISMVGNQIQLAFNPKSRQG